MYNFFQNQHNFEGLFSQLSFSNCILIQFQIKKIHWALRVGQHSGEDLLPKVVDFCSHTIFPLWGWVYSQKEKEKKVGTLWSELGVVYLTIYTSICSYEMCTLIPHFDWGAEAEAENFIICDLHLAFFIWPTSLRLISGTRHKKGKNWPRAKHL